MTISRAIYVPDDSGQLPPYYWVPLQPGDTEPSTGPDMGDDNSDGVPNWLEQFNAIAASGALAWWGGGSSVVDGLQVSFMGQYHPLLDGDRDHDGIPDFIPGIWTHVQGCTEENREPQLINWWNVQVKALGFEIKAIPEGRKWCSQHPSEGWVDETLRESDPDRYWELQGWIKLDQFTNDPSKRDGKYRICNHCRARHKRMMYALQKQERGETVRNYRRAS